MNIGEVALAYWRLSKWVNGVNTERKTAATSSLRLLSNYLKENNIEIKDYVGQQYDVGMAFDVVGKDSEDDKQEEDLIISETLTPLILQNGEVIRFGQVTLGSEVKNNMHNIEAPVNKKDDLVIQGQNLDQLLAEINSLSKMNY